MTDTTYNGWTNRATWLAKIWFEPNSRADLDLARETIDEAYDAMPDFMRDFLCTDQIDWAQLEEHCEEEASECK
jgi:hypothetical protein